MLKSIQVYGTGCPSCEKLYRNVQKAVEELGLNIGIEKIEDLNALLQSGIMRTPALGFDGKIILQGKIPNLATLQNWINKAIQE